MTTKLNFHLHGNFQLLSIHEILTWSVEVSPDRFSVCYDYKYIASTGIRAYTYSYASQNNGTDCTSRLTFAV